jgi:hypothetical protein
MSQGIGAHVEGRVASPAEAKRPSAAGEEQVETAMPRAD